jgi:hypothetical protein
MANWKMWRNLKNDHHGEEASISESMKRKKAASANGRWRQLSRVNRRATASSKIGSENQ